LGDLSESSRLAYYLLIPSLAVVAAVAVYPVASGVWLSFQRYNLSHLGEDTPIIVKHLPAEQALAAIVYVKRAAEERGLSWAR